MKLVRLNKINTGFRVSSLGGALLTLALAPGCGDSTDSNAQPDVSPQTLFETTAKPQLVQACAVCHGVAQSGGMVPAFLPAGMEYSAITGYKSGTFLNVPMATQSLLLQKGAHTGPALSPDQYAAVQSWIEAEVASRPSTMAGMMKSALLPTAPITTGDFNMNFGSEAPINDPEANLTFHLEPDSSNLYRVSGLTLTAGATTGIHIGHPKFYFINAKSSFADPADSLATVDQVVGAGQSITVGLGTVLLTNAPTNDPNTRIGVAFQVLQTAMVTNVMLACKDLKDFNPAVVKDLQGCAGMCHSPGKNNSAASAFDMSASTSTDPTALATFCIQSLGRINTTMPAKSILLTQAIPVAMGGTPNHPFKYSLAADITRFTNEVTTWATAEK